MSFGPPPPCLSCARLLYIPFCEAFGRDKQIPKIILGGGVDHKTPIEGDHGLLYTPDAATLLVEKLREKKQP